MQEQLIKDSEALVEKLKGLEDKNPAAWKARRKIEAAIAIVKSDWPKEEAAKAKAK